MKDIVSCIEDLRSKLDRYRKEDLKEYPTRIIFVDPLLKALGWDVRDTDEVELEYSTIDGKSVDYAPKINRGPVLFIEAKPLNNPLAVKSITQVVGYAANAGVEWCILTNGVTYKVYQSTKKAKAPDKLLFEVSIDPRESEGRSVQQIAEQFNRFSRDAMERKVLDEIGETEQGYFTEPFSSSEDKEELRRQTSPIAAMMDECCEFDRISYVLNEQLYDLYKSWAKENGYPVFNRIWFGRYVIKNYKNKITHYRPIVKGQRVRCTQGIKITDEAYQRYLGRPTQ
ncbi:MAG: type I restriction enzyme HsdR N-terminal domain-containing protein [Planctomycetota bacterium]|nr:type I restriction enzyme HsdR N-terminal domain-containing protein [Planctomycetota bacterium]